MKQIYNANLFLEQVVFTITAFGKYNDFLKYTNQS